VEPRAPLPLRQLKDFATMIALHVSEGIAIAGGIAIARGLIPEQQPDSQ
jgi:hypothetical protein